MKTVTIGNVQVTALLDTPALMNADHFFHKHAAALRAEFSHMLDERGHFKIAITTYLVRSAGRTYIVDTGVGPRRRSGLPRGSLDVSLREAGIDPGSIDVVLNTHMHVDHVGWNTIDREDGTKQIFFPNAKFLYQQIEWDYWMAPEQLTEDNQYLLDCVVPLQDTGRVELMSGEVAIDENLTYISTPGHTIGHVAIGIQSAGERAVIIGDASHHPAQLIHPDWSPQPDYDPVMSAQSRDKLFDDAAADGRTWMAGHWDFPGMGRLVRLDGKRVFQAL